LVDLQRRIDDTNRDQQCQNVTRVFAVGMAGGADDSIRVQVQQHHYPEAGHRPVVVLHRKLHLRT
jgi:hypothetical protein